MLTNVVHFTASNVWRGHEQMIIDLFESFRDFEFVKHQVIICNVDSAIFKVATEKKLNVIGFEIKSGFDLKFAKKLKNFTESNHTDILMIHNSKAHKLSVLAGLFYGLKTPMVLCRTMMEKVDTNVFRKWKYNYKGIKKIVCISEPVVEVLKPAIKDHNKMTVVGSVVDTERYINKTKNGYLHKEFNIPTDHKIIGNISAFCEVKDHFTWVNTVAELKQRNLKATYILIGDGPMEQEIKDYVISKGLQNDIIFAGFRKDVPLCLTEFDLFLFTSKNEATGGVILESYACKVPVVASNAGGIPTVLIDNETGLLAEVGNPVDFADKSIYLLNNKQLQDKFIKNGFEFLMETSSREVISKKMIAVLNQVVQL